VSHVWKVFAFFFWAATGPQVFLVTTLEKVRHTETSALAPSLFLAENSSRPFHLTLFSRAALGLLLREGGAVMRPP